jgi:hypothetical protein
VHDLTPSKHLLDRRASALRADVDTTGAADDLLSTRQLAKLLGTSEQWLETGRSSGKFGPPFLKLSYRCIRYRCDAVAAWLAERAHASTLEYETPQRRPGSRPRGRPRKVMIEPNAPRFRRTKWPESDAPS